MLKYKSTRLKNIFCWTFLFILMVCQPVYAEGEEKAEKKPTITGTVEGYIDFSQELPADMSSEEGLFSIQSPNVSEYYGDQLDTNNAECIYKKLKNAYYTNRSYGEVDMELAEPIYWDAEISGNQVVENQAYKDAISNVNYSVFSAGWALYFDFPEIFWMNGVGYSCSYSITSVNGKWIGCIKKLYYEPNTYYDGATSEISDYDAEVSKAVKEIQSKTQNNDRGDILSAIHDYVCEKAEYNYDAVYDYIPQAHTSSTVFIGDGGVVCEGYAKAFKVLCNQFDIPCTLVSGANHMWNHVQMPDNKWYGIDTTWDDQDTILYEHFLVGSQTICFSQTFGEEHPDEMRFWNQWGTSLFRAPTLNEVKYDEVQVTPGDEYIKGDVTNDGVVTLTDLMQILKYTSRQISFDSKQIKAADIDGNGIVTMSDLIKILQFVNRRIEVL